MNAVIDAEVGIGAKLFNQAAKVITRNTETEVNEAKVEEAAGEDNFIKKEELIAATKTPETNPVTESGKAANQQKVNETWNQVASTIMNETKNLTKSEAKIKEVKEDKTIANTESTVSLGGETTIQGTNTTVNTVATETQFDELETQIERNQEIIEANNRNIDLSTKDEETKKKNEQVKLAYENLYKIDQQLKEYEDKLAKDKKIAEQNQLDEINQQEEYAEKRTAELRKNISDFHNKGNATIRLQNGAFITNNAIKLDGKGIEVISEPGENNLSETQVAIKYNYDGKTYERLIDTNDKYTSISQTPEENKDNHEIIGDKGLLATIESSSDSDQVSLNAVAFDKSNGQEVNIEGLDNENDIPTKITVGESLSSEEIEQDTPIFLRLSDVSIIGEKQDNQDYSGTHTPQHYYTFNLRQDQFEQLILARANDYTGLGIDAQWLNKAYEYNINTNSNEQEKTFGNYDLITKIRNPDGSFTYKVQLSDKAYQRFNNYT